MPEQFPYPNQGWSTGKMRMAGDYTPGTTLGMFPTKKKKQLDKEQQKENLEEQKYQMSPKQLRDLGVTKGYKPDFDYAFGQTAPKESPMTPAQVAFGEKAPQLSESASGKAEATPSDATMATLLTRRVAGPMGIAPTILGKQLTQDEPTEADVRKKKKQTEQTAEAQ
jgi:hypothetical protein